MQDTAPRWDADPVVAIDTEYQGTHTLTIQAAARIEPDTIAVQIYYSPDIPPPPAAFDIGAYIPEKYGKFCPNVILRPAMPISPDITPLWMLRDLFDICPAELLYREEGLRRLESFTPANARETNHGNAIPSLLIRVAAHTLTVDFLRIYSKGFFDLLNYAPGMRSQICIQARKYPRLAEINGRRQNSKPVVEFLLHGDEMYAVQIDHRDIARIYHSNASLEALSQTFLGIGKCRVITDEEKADMRRVFHVRTGDGYGYAAVDAVNTLLVYERMQAVDRQMYREFGIPEERVPRMRSTLGSRVSAFIETGVCQAIGTDSRELASKTAVISLMKNGGIKLFENRPSASRYGKQTWQVHGGLLLSRSPTRIWHESAGNIIDVDFTGCYAALAAQLHAYFGRPVIYEPGATAMTLREGVRLMEQLADADAWMIKATGEMPTIQNALVPSTEGAITSQNYRPRLRTGKRRQQQRQALHLEILQDPALQDAQGARLYSGYVAAGVVTHATWKMIQAMPQDLREQYENLTVDTLLYYPELLVAENGKQFDELVDRFHNPDLPWRSTLEHDGLEIVTREAIDHENVSFRYPLGKVVQRMIKLRNEAKQQGNSGMDAAWKAQSNTVYGVLSSQHMLVQNVLAANQITAWARAAVYGVGMALHAVQINTDGCSLRRDQIPACTFAECLRRMPDYPVRRADAGDGIPFLDPATVPLDRDGFAAWYREHLRRFFGDDHPEPLFEPLDLRLKLHGRDERPCVDALACDGAANYIKLDVQPDGGHRVVEAAMRGYGRESKKVLVPRIIATYSSDQLDELLPLAEDSSLLTYSRARQMTRKAFSRGMTKVLFPMGLEVTNVKSYAPIKPSVFIFTTPEQRIAVLKQLQRFQERNGCSIEVLALRRGYRDRRAGSLQDLLEEIYRLIRRGDTNIAKALNIRKIRPLHWIITARRSDLAARRDEVESDLLGRIDVNRTDCTQPGPTLILSPETIDHILSA
jgi:hypothetical protein